MHLRTLILGCLLCLSIHPASAIGQHAQLETLHWLIGTWQRVGLSDERSGEERWWLADNGELHGIGSSRRGDVVLFEERLRITMVDGTPVYIADVRGNEAPVEFRLVEIDDSGFVFENLGHDFPQRIAYRRDGERLHARVSAGERSLDFHFQRQP